MTKNYKLSLPAAILININIMMSSGIFINMLPLSKAAGLLGSVVYAAVGILMFPIVLTIAKLLQIYPGGSFYIFGSKSLNKFFGFFATWFYFIGKLASATLLIHFFSLIIQSLFPIFSQTNTLYIDFFIILLFSYLNVQNLKLGSIIQFAFIFFKAIPILFIILSGIFLFNPTHLSSQFLLWKGIFPVIPLVVFAFAGFEASASISRHISNPDRNAPLAVLISFAIVIFICVISNFLYFILLGPDVFNAANYFEAIPLLLKKIFPQTDFLKLNGLFQLAIACSALGGAYGIFFSNSWNLYSLSENKHLFFNSLFSKLNKFNIPIFCIFTEALICIFYLMVTKGNNISLQQMAAFGNLSAYMISAISLFFVGIKQRTNSFWIGLFAVINCLILLVICFKQIISTTGLYFYIFLSLLLLGLVAYFFQNKR